MIICPFILNYIFVWEMALIIKRHSYIWFDNTLTRIATYYRRGIYYFNLQKGTKVILHLCSSLVQYLEKLFKVGERDKWSEGERRDRDRKKELWEVTQQKI
jgi:hypothetical protein